MTCTYHCLAPALTSVSIHHRRAHAPVNTLCRFASSAVLTQHAAAWSYNIPGPEPVAGARWSRKHLGRPLARWQPPAVTKAPCGHESTLAGHSAIHRIAALLNPMSPTTTSQHL